MTTERCARCGEPALGYARGWKGERLCHPDDPAKPDCYTLTIRTVLRDVMAHNRVVLEHLAHS